MATLPQTQAEARDILKQQMVALEAQFNKAKQEGTLTNQQATQLQQQYADLTKQLSAASAGTARSVGKGLLSGIEQGFQFPMQGAKLAAPLAMFPAQVGQAALNKMYGRTVNEPQSQEQLIPFRAGQGAGSLLSSLIAPGATAPKALATSAGLTAADIGIESQGGPQSLASTVYLLKALTGAGWQGLKSWREGRKFEDLMKNLPEDMPELERNALKRFMLTGQGSDNGIVAAAMQKLETKPQYAEMLKKLREGATEQTLTGMRPDVGRLTKEQTATGFVQTIQNKLDGLKETIATTIFDPDRLSLYEKAKGYGGGKAIVDPSKTVANIDGLIADYEKKNTPDADNSVKALRAIRERFAPTFTTKGSEGTTITRAGEPSITTAGAPARTVTEEIPVIKYDSLGMPYQTTETRTRTVAGFGGTTIAGTPDVNINIPGAPSIKVQQNARPVTIDEIQGVLSEFGKKASKEDRLLQDLSISSERRISAAIFGGMQDDIRDALGKVTDPNDRKALTLLMQARQKTSDAVNRYNEAIAQGMPAFLKDADPKSLDFQTLVTQYEKLTPQQRASVRQWVGDTDPEVLKQFDRTVYENFLNKARDDSGRVDLGSLTQLWNKSTPSDRDALVTALGVNAGEFTARMRDATAFSNRVRVAQPAQQTDMITEVAPSAARLAGTTLGYGAHQGVMLSADIAKQLLDKTKLTDDQLMKLLLTPEGADFLKTQKMTPGSTKLLDDLTKVTTTPTPPMATVQQVGTAISAPPTTQTTPQPVELPEFNMVDIPEEPTTNQQEQKLPDFQMVD